MIRKVRKRKGMGTVRKQKVMWKRKKEIKLSCISGGKENFFLWRKCTTGFLPSVILVLNNLK